MFFKQRCRRREEKDNTLRLIGLITTAFELYIKREINMSTTPNPLDVAIGDVATAEGSLETRLQAIIDTLKANQSDPTVVAAQVAQLEALAARMTAFDAPPATPPAETPAA